MSAKHKYYWGRFKDTIHTQDLLIIRVEQDYSRFCNIMACDEIFCKNEFIFYQEIIPPKYDFSTNYSLGE